MDNKPIKTELAKTGLALAIFEAREKSNLTQEALAAKANVSVKTVRLIEKGGSARDSTLDSICEGLGIPSIVLRCMAASDEDKKKIEALLKIHNSQ